MFTITQTPGAAVNFDGLTSGPAGTGLIDFAELELPVDPDWVPIITSVGYDNNAAEGIAIDCFLKPSAAALTTTLRKTIRRPAATINGFNIDGCRIPVPRRVEGTPLVLTPWVLILITGGKTAVGSFVVSFTMGPVPGCGC